MNAIDAIRMAYAVTEGSVAMLEDMRDAPLTRTSTPGGNHPLWILGHLTVTEGAMPQILFGEPNPVAHWEPLFAPGSIPSDNPQDYPTFDELLETFKKLRARNLHLLEQLGEAGLDQPTKAPFPGLEDWQGTVGRALLLTALHQMFHGGQVADARRAAGRKPLFM